MASKLANDSTNDSDLLDEASDMGDEPRDVSASACVVAALFLFTVEHSLELFDDDDEDDDEEADEAVAVWTKPESK